MLRDFLKPETIEEALRLRHEIADSVYIAGGAEVNSLYWETAHKNIAQTAISVAGILDSSITKDNDGVHIGANAVIQDLLETSGVPRLLQAAARQFVSRNVRCVATIGGHVAIGMSCGNVICALTALDAIVETYDKNGAHQRKITDFLASHDPRELVTGVFIPCRHKQFFWGTRVYRRTANDISIIITDVIWGGTKEKLEDVRIVVGGVAEVPVRLEQLERELEGKALPSREEIEEKVKGLISPMSDLRGSAEFKRHIAAVLTAWSLHNVESNCCCHTTEE
ncbi:MAG: FAD binding domain-containing protein [bacterium]|nr:FAD binding domain-containing protein [bacterium]